MVANAMPEFEKLGCEDHLQHLRVPQHGVDQERFASMVNWIEAQSADFRTT